jgi:hypothetical protein
MRTHKKILLFLLLFVLVFAAGCKESSDTSGDGEKEGFPEGVEGTALITYEFSSTEMPAWVTSAYVEIPIQLKIDPDDETIMNIRGDAHSTHYIQIKGAGGPTGTCFIQCDYPIHYYFIGTLNRTEKKGEKGCSIDGEFVTVYDIQDVNRYGDCPEVMVKKQDCIPLLLLPDDKKYQFTKDKLVDEKSKNPEEKATLSQVKFTQHIQKECNWKTESK